MNGLMRELAPVTGEGWKEIEEEAKRTLTTFLAGRKLVDFSGPHGWRHGAVDTGRVESIGSAIEGVHSVRRTVQPLVELRVPFTLSRAELDALGRGADDADLDPVVHAAKHIAQAEDRAIFHGWREAGIHGIAECAAEATLKLSEDYTAYPVTVNEALHKLRSAGIGGPYAIALGPRCYGGLHQTFTPAGYPVYRQVEQLLDGPMVWAPSVDGAVVLSLRGGDFELTIGQDLSIGYDKHDEHDVHLYLQETLTFRCLSPEAAVPLRY